MSTKPTRDSVEEMLNDFEAHELIGSRRDVYELVVNVFKDWLAQEEELKELARFIRAKGYVPCDIEACNCGSYHGGHSARRLTEIGDVLSEYRSMSGVVILDGIKELIAENQALKASMEADYIERQAKHIQELVKENEALKEALEGLDSLERYTHLYEDQQP